MLCVCVCAVAVVGVLLLLLSRLLLVRPRAHHSQCLFSPVVRAFACAIRAHNCYLRCFTSWNCFGCCCLFCIVSFSFVLFFCLAVFIYFTRAIERRSLSRRFHTHTQQNAFYFCFDRFIEMQMAMARSAIFCVDFPVRAATNNSHFSLAMFRELSQWVYYFTRSLNRLSLRCITLQLIAIGRVLHRAHRTTHLRFT